MPDTDPKGSLELKTLVVVWNWDWDWRWDWGLFDDVPNVSIDKWVAWTLIWYEFWSLIYFLLTNVADLSYVWGFLSFFWSSIIFSIGISPSKSTHFLFSCYSYFYRINSSFFLLTAYEFSGTWEKEFQLFSN